MTDFYHILVQPFIDDTPMRRALVACVALSLSGAPLGVFLVLRRMTLMGDAMSHGVLSGVAVAFVMFGTSFWAMSIGGVAAGLIVAAISGAITRLTPLKEDASLGGIYLISLAASVLILSRDTDALENALFGNALNISHDALQWAFGVTSFSLLVLAIIYRGLIIECFDPGFLRAVKGNGAFYHQCFLMLMVINLVSAFQTMGMLMALGLITLPAISTRLWTRNIDSAIPLAMLFAMASGVSGLLVTYHTHQPSGPAIVLSAGVIYVGSVFFGASGGIVMRLLPHKHLVG